MADTEKRELIRRARRSLTRLARFTNRLQRTQLSCGPVTVQQCHTLEALTSGPLPMNKLADEVALHQSTLTRVVEKLEEKGLVARARPANNQRVVQVSLTDSGRDLFTQIDATSNQMIAQIIALVDPIERPGAVRGLEVLCDLLDPQNVKVQQIIAGCCCGDLPQIQAAGSPLEVER
jgi:DNA-binding MarR family transcriptional regulator